MILAAILILLLAAIVRFVWTVKQLWDLTHYDLERLDP